VIVICFPKVCIKKVLETSCIVLDSSGKAREVANNLLVPVAPTPGSEVLVLAGEKFCMCFVVGVSTISKKRRIFGKHRNSCVCGKRWRSSNQVCNARRRNSIFVSLLVHEIKQFVGLKGALKSECLGIAFFFCEFSFFFLFFFSARGRD
jgi:hypothetical protein